MGERFLPRRLHARQRFCGVAFRPRRVGARNRWRSLRWRSVTVLGLVGLAVLVSSASAEHSVIELVGGTHIAWVSEDGSRVLFYAQEPLASEDTDASQDVYERSGGG